ncbi:hypothetical protein M8C21_011447 [Ambrosia artemisiifolia]|uniref:Uncharacterized protein n=2 Tax=Ambrosia artemisiifolia TaxID=4212 RepID=A0AAD5GUW1_AMBAR|nr:hypothetical protein M8C21_011447 [Ambrosia artemisiifolia]
MDSCVFALVAFAKLFDNALDEFCNVNTDMLRNKKDGNISIWSVGSKLIPTSRHKPGYNFYIYEVGLHER